MLQAEYGSKCCRRQWMLQYWIWQWMLQCCRWLNAAVLNMAVNAAVVIWQWMLQYCGRDIDQLWTTVYVCIRRNISMSMMLVIAYKQWFLYNSPLRNCVQGLAGLVRSLLHDELELHDWNWFQRKEQYDDWHRRRYRCRPAYKLKISQGLHINRKNKPISK